MHYEFSLVLVSTVMAWLLTRLAVRFAHGGRTGQLFICCQPTNAPPSVPWLR